MKRTLAVVGLFYFCLGVVAAQVTGVATLQGVVTDESGAVVTNAEITAVNIETGVTVKTATNEVGLYRVPGLNPGRYSVEARATGFALSRIGEVRLEVGQTARLDLRLKVGGISETVEVTAQGTLLNSETTDVGQVIGLGSGLHVRAADLVGKFHFLAQLDLRVQHIGQSPTQMRLQDMFQHL